MNLIIAPSGLDFLWNDQRFKILECGIDNDIPFAKVDPPNSGLESELKKRIKQDKGLKVYHGFNYTCFVEDYIK